MKTLQLGSRLLRPKNLEILRPFQTANQKQVEAAAVLDHADTKTEWDLAKPYKDIPGPKPLPIPYVGNLWRLMFTKWGSDMTLMNRELYETYGPIVKLSGMGRVDMVFLFDPVDVEKMFRNESAWPERMAMDSLKYYRTVLRKDFYGDQEGLVTSQGEKWQEFRTVSNYAMMQPRNALMYLDLVSSVTDDFVERIRYIRKPNKEMPEDFMNELNKLALESAGVVTLDTRLGCLKNDLSPDSEAMVMIHSAVEALSLMHKLEFGGSPWKFFPTPTWKKFVKVMDDILKISMKYTNDKWEKMQKQGFVSDNPNKSILELLLLKTKDSKIPLVMATDVLFAGIDTTSNTTGTILYHLAVNPEKQERLFQELKQYLPTKNTKITKDIFNELKYLKAVVKESLRLTPTAGANQRMAKKDLVVRGFQIPQGVSLLAGHQVMCRLESYFREPIKFIPERWLKSESDSEYSCKSKHPFVFLPFGFGQRSCVGKRIAELEIELAVTKIIRNFQVGYHHEPMTWSTRLVTAPSKPLKFEMIDRPE